MTGGAQVPRRILVTGGTGFVGTHLVAHLRSRIAPGSTILVAGRGEAGIDVRFDLARPETIAAAVARCAPDVVLHLAGEASVATASDAAADTWRVNVAGTLELAAAFGAGAPAGTFLFTSSAEVYGRAFRAGPADETTRPDPDTIYGRSKLAAEAMLADVLPRSVRLIVARPSNHIGPGQSDRFAMPSFARQIAEAEAGGAPITIRVGNLDAERDFMDVRDVVRAYGLLLALDLPEGARETFNLSSGVTRSVRAMLDAMRGLARVDSDVRADPARFRAAEVMRASVDSARLSGVTGWRPQVAIDTSLVDALDDARERFHRG